MANRFLGLNQKQKIKFMEQDLDIKKLSVAEVLEIQALAKQVEDNPNEENNMMVLCKVIQQGAAELSDLTDEEMRTFPMDELSKLSTAIMKYSGLLNKDETKR